MTRFKDAYKSEWLKVFTTKTWWVLALVMVLYIGFTAALMSLLLTQALGPDAEQALPDVISPTDTIYSLGSAMGYLFPVLVGALSVTTEYRHHTITPTFIAAGRRGPVLTAKVAVQATVGFLYGVFALASAVLAGVFILLSKGIDSGLADGDTWLMFLRSVVVMGLWAVIGVGLGVLIRSQAGAIVLVLVFTQFIEPLARTGASFNDFLSNLVRFLPGSASDAFVGESIYSAIAASGGGAPMLTWWQGGLILAFYGALLVVIGGLTRWQSDVS